MDEKQTKAVAVLSRARGDSTTAAEVYVKSLLPEELDWMAALDYMSEHFPAKFREVIDLIADRKFLEERAADLQKRREAKQAAEPKVEIKVVKEPAPDEAIAEPV